MILKANKFKSYFKPPFATEVSGTKLPKLIYNNENAVNNDRNKGYILTKRLLKDNFDLEKVLEIIYAKINHSIIKANSILNNIDNEQKK
tara:strand:- start:86 stop:352 length:267 start_codon:yes stop_codon:yes gene_type:complete